MGSSEATGVIADLFAEDVGFGAGWGLSRTVEDLTAGLLTPAGGLDWRSLHARVESALVELLAAPPAAAGLPEGVSSFGPELFAGVAVSQGASGWASLLGKPAGARRLVVLRCHAGKRRAGGELRNAVLIQYRAWTRAKGGAPKPVLESARVGALVADLHAEIEKRLRK